MKKLSINVLRLLLLTSCVFSSLVLGASRFEVGKHYQVINEPKSTSPMVTEVFSFYCPACYGFETVINGIEKSLPTGVKFNKSHVDFMHQASAEKQQLLSRALVVGYKLNMGHKMIDAIFNHIHRDKEKFADVDDVRALFVAKGVDGATFDKAFDSFVVKGEANRMKQYQVKLSNAKLLDSIPALIVNQKYKILRKELHSLAEYNALIAFLLALP